MEREELCSKRFVKQKYTQEEQIDRKLLYERLPYNESFKSVI